MIRKLLKRILLNILIDDVELLVNVAAVARANTEAIESLARSGTYLYNLHDVNKEKISKLGERLTFLERDFDNLKLDVEEVRSG